MHRNTYIKTIPRNTCLICNKEGVRKYSRMQDVLFEAPLTWNIDTCNDCNLLWLNPSPTPESLEKLYTNYYTHSQLFNDFLTKKDFRDFPTNKQIKYSILSAYYKYPIQIPKKNKIFGYLLGLIPGVKEKVRRSTGGFPYSKKSRILDVGCGNGDYLLEMKYLGFNVSGIEIDSSAVKTAKKHGLDVL